MAKIVKTVEVRTRVRVAFEPDLLPDDDWRRVFYDIRTPEQLAEHFAHNRVVNGIQSLSALDGFADRSDSDLAVEILESEVECEP